MASRLHRQGPRGNLELAFGARMREIERAWRSHLDEILYPQAESLEAPSVSDALKRPDIDLELGTPPEFRFDPRRPHRSQGELVEDEDQQGGDRERHDDPDREAQGRADPRQ
jgi:hypothetical protein